MEYRKFYKKAKKFNSINTFIEILERKSFNKLCGMLDQLEKNRKIDNYLKNQ